MGSENPVPDGTEPAEPGRNEAVTMRSATAAAPAPIDRRQSAAALAIRRGTVRLLAARGYASLPEVTVPNGRRADLLAIGRHGEIWIVEIKSCRADFEADTKWHEYRDFADRLWFAVNADFPITRLPEDVGIIAADRFGAAILREAPVHRLAPARAKALHLRVARLASTRLAAIEDPHGLADWSRTD